MIVPKSDRTRGPSFTMARSLTMDNLGGISSRASGGRSGGESPMNPLQAPFTRLPPIDPKGGGLGSGLRGSEFGAGIQFNRNISGLSFGLKNHFSFGSRFPYSKETVQKWVV